jgi:hypothetical protein
MRNWSSLDDVVAAIAWAVAGHDRRIWIGRSDNRWRWSFATPGGAYPLLRTVASYLEMDHHRLLMSFTTTEDGYAIVEGKSTADSEVTLSVPAGATPTEVEALIAGSVPVRPPS